MYPTQRCCLQLQRLGEPPGPIKFLVLGVKICYMIYTSQKERIESFYKSEEGIVKDASQMSALNNWMNVISVMNKDQ